MARIVNGINGGGSGNVGPANMYRLNGKDFLRARRKTGVRVKSEGNLQSWGEHSVINTFLRENREFLVITLSGARKGNNWYQAGYSLNRHQVKGTYPDFSLDYPALTLGAGRLPLPETLSMTRDGNILSFGWDSGNGTGTDQLLLGLYAPDKGWCQVIRGNLRRDKSFQTTIHELLLKEEVHLWAVFVSDTRKGTSAGKYMGVLRPEAENASRLTKNEAESRMAATCSFVPGTLRPQAAGR
jgi:hypothetical protein